MASLLDMRRRIRSVKNTQQITKAMKMMSAARLRRAQERVTASRPYARLMREFLGRMVASLPEPVDDQPIHPLLAVRPEKRILILVLGGDKGLAGAFNTNIHKAAQGFLDTHADKHIDMIAIGRKPRDFFKRRRALVADFADIFAKVRYENAKDIAKIVTQMYAEEKVDAVYLLFNEFKSVLVQRLQIERLLPVETPPAPQGAATDYIYEQTPAEILDSLVPRYVEVQLFRALLESAAAEHAARMTAMDSASKNAADMIDRLTLNMNRLRQATITREIIEIVSGAAALG
jgi:F-type H+-transporting ATPase subunit gamma